MSNLGKMTLIAFLTRFHLYLHVYALYLQGRGLSLVEISSIETMVVVASFLAEVPTGVIADRIGRKWAISASVLLMACAELLFMFSNSYPLYLVVGALTGIGFAFMSGAGESLIYESLTPPSAHPMSETISAEKPFDREATMARVMGRIGSAGQIGFVLGPILGGLILGGLGEDRFAIAIGLTSAVLFVAFGLSLTLREPPTAWHADRQSSLAILRSGAAELRGSPALRRFLLLLLFTWPFNGTLVTTFAAPYLSQNSVPPYWIGLALAGGSLLAALAQRNAYRLEAALGRQRAITVLLLFPGVMYLLLAAVTGPITWGIVVLMYGTNDMKAPLFSAYQNTLIAGRNRATVLSLMNMVMNVFVALMAPLYALIALASLPGAFVAIGAVILVAGTVLLGRERRMQTAMSNGYVLENSKELP